MKRWCIQLVMLAALVGVQQGKAAVVGYGVATDSKLYSIDVSTATATAIGDMGVFLEAIALSPGGALYGTDATGSLYGINRTTAVTSLIGGTGLGNIEGLDFNGSQLIGIDFNLTPTVYSINIANGSATSLVTSQSQTGMVRAMTVQDGNTLLIRTDGSNYLRSLDLSTGATSVIGNLGGPHTSPAGLDFAMDGKLYGLQSDGTVIRIDPSNANTTLIGDTGDQFWLGLAAAPIPEPSTVIIWSLLGTLAITVGWWQRRRAS